MSNSKNNNESENNFPYEIVFDKFKIEKKNRKRFFWNSIHGNKYSKSRRSGNKNRNKQ